MLALLSAAELLGIARDQVAAGRDLLDKEADRAPGVVGQAVAHREGGVAQAAHGVGQTAAARGIAGQGGDGRR